MVIDQDYYTAGEKEFLLKIAMKSLEKFLLSGEKFEPQTINKKLWEKRGVFVTINSRNKLHGCMGNIEPVEPLILAVRNNVLLAANDPRFESLKAIDFKSVEIEISVLSELEKVTIDKIKPGDGVLIKNGHNFATYLPSVWKSLKTKDDFLFSLADKAGLDSNACSSQETEFWIYKTISFK